MEYASQLAATLATVARTGFVPPFYMHEALMEQVRTALPHMTVEQLCSRYVPPTYARASALFVTHAQRVTPP